MKSCSSRLKLGALLGATVLSVALIGAALAQPPKPGGSGGGPSGPASAPGGGPAPGGAGPGGSGPGGGTPSPTFTYEMCNKANDGVVFVATVSIVGQQFRAQGWTQIPQGQCVRLGPFQRPSLWWYARATSGVTWGKADINICVNLNGGFDYTWDGAGRPCTQAETAAAFVKADIAPQYNLSGTNLKSLSVRASQARCAACNAGNGRLLASQGAAEITALAWRIECEIGRPSDRTGRLFREHTCRRASAFKCGHFVGYGYPCR